MLSGRGFQLDEKLPICERFINKPRLRPSENTVTFSVFRSELSFKAWGKSSPSASVLEQT